MMAASLDQLAAVAQFELAAKMQSIVDRYDSVNPSRHTLVKEEVDRWTPPKPSSPTQAIDAEEEDDEMDDSPPADSNEQCHSIQELKRFHPPTSLISESATTHFLVTETASSVPTDLPCSVVVVSSGSSDLGPSSHTPSSIGTSPPLSNEGSHLDIANSNSATSNNEVNDASKNAMPSQDCLNQATNASCSLTVDTKQGVIATGARFNSFAEFEHAFDLWKQMYHHPFRVASSETLRQPDGTVNETFKYRYIVYHCAHYGLPRMRGVGKRPNQKYLPCGCRAMLRLNFNWAENALRITTLHDQHTSHDLSAESYAKIASKLRRFSPTSTSDRSPVIRRPQAQHPLQNPLLDNSLGHEGAMKQSPSVSPQNTSWTESVPPTKTPLAMLAQNVSQIGAKKEGTNANSPQQCNFQAGASAQCSGLQNLAAVAAAIKQQQMAAALFAHHKENMNFGFPAAAVLSQPPVPNSPQLLPLLRGMLGLPNFGSPFLSPAMLGAAEVQQPVTNVDAQSSSTVTQSADPNLGITQTQQTSPFTANYLSVQQQQLQQQQLQQQQQQLAAALSFVQRFRQPQIIPPAPLQSVIPQGTQQAAMMSTQAAIPTSLASTPVAQAVTPIDLSTTASSSSSSIATQYITPELDRFKEVAGLLRSMVSPLLKCETEMEYTRRVTHLKTLLKMWQTDNEGEVGPAEAHSLPSLSHFSQIPSGNRIDNVDFISQCFLQTSADCV